MRFLLINPFYPISETPSPPLGLAFLAASLEQAGVKVKILDLVVSPYSKRMLESVLEEFSPHFVGTTSVTMTFDNAIGVLRDVKSVDPNVLTVMGGPHVTFCAEDTMRTFPFLDLIALGEGEETIVDLIKEAEGKREWGKISGIVYRNGPEILSTGIREPVADVDSLPIPARHLLPLGRYRALGMAISMTTSRGCPFKCIFCVGRKMVGPKVRYRDPVKVVDELEYLNSLNFHQINIADDLFTAKEGHCISVCNEIIRRALKVKWTSFARVDTVSKKVLSKMKEAGCQAVSFGIESANPEILKTIKKGITIDQVIAAVNACNEAGVKPHASFILGLPGETPETLKESVDFGEKLKKMGVSHGFHLLAPFPGTEIREKSDKFGIKILTSDWSQYHANRAIVETPSVSRKLLDDTVKEWEEEFDEWLGYIKEQMEIGKATEDEAWQLDNLERTILIYDLMMGSVIENKGVWACKSKLASDDALKALVNRVTGSVDYTPEHLYETLKFTMARENLRYTQEKGQIRWQWVEYL
jgi:radical SAM superfamily enzyme YgiQ (UPF0313 family)